MKTILMFTVLAGLAVPVGRDADDVLPTRVPIPDCYKCTNTEFLGEPAHTTVTGEGAIQMGEQESGHTNESHCDDEPHGNPCGFNCWTAHKWCETPDEEQDALVLASRSSDPWALTDAVRATSGLVIVNKERSAVQVLSTCAGEVVLHIPLSSEKIAELAATD